MKINKPHPVDQLVLDTADYYVWTHYGRPRKGGHWQQSEKALTIDAALKLSHDERSILYACTNQGRYAMVPKEALI